MTVREKAEEYARDVIDIKGQQIDWCSNQDELRKLIALCYADGYWDGVEHEG